MEGEMARSKQFKVRAGHIDPRWRLDDVIVTVECRPWGENGEDVWFWSHSQFGSSKYYSTPEKAIYGMLSDNGCNVMQAWPVE
jgi:hypothetical protein